MTVHRFDDSLDFSHAEADAPYWEPVYRQAFPTLAQMLDVRSDGWHQRSGVDRVLTLTDTTQVLVDEKVRREAWPDILLEVWSDHRRKAQGWAVKPAHCDYVAYALKPVQTCYLLPLLLTQRALKDNWQDWQGNADANKRGFRWVDAQNVSWVTRSIAIPTTVLLDAIRDTLVINWGRTPVPVDLEPQHLPRPASPTQLDIFGEAS